MRRFSSSLLALSACLFFSCSTTSDIVPDAPAASTAELATRAAAASGRQIPVASATAAFAHSANGIALSYDGDYQTYYMSHWSNTTFPFDVVYNFDDVDKMDYMIYHPRGTASGTGVNGLLGRVDVWYATQSNPTFTKYGEYDFEKVASMRKIEFQPALVNPTQIKLVLYQGYGSGTYAAIGEMEFFKEDTALFEFGLIADIQYADANPANNRYYRNSLAKLEACVADLNSRGVDFTVNLGDLTDKDTQLSLPPVLTRLNVLDAPVYNTSGNHDYDSIPSNAWLYTQMGMPAEYYSFVHQGWRFIILNTNEISSYGSDTPTEQAEFTALRQLLSAQGRPYASYNGGVSQTQLEWLENQLIAARAASQKTLVFSHHPLYGPNGLLALNDREIVAVLMGYTDTVKGVVGGHHHSGHYGEYSGLPFITTEGMIETADTNAYGIVTIYPDDRIELWGVGRTRSHTIQ